MTPRQGIAYELLKHLSADGKRIVVVMASNLYQAYLDESGTHEGAPILAVAGYFGIDTEWAIYLDRWKHKDFHARKNQFDRLKPELADAIDAANLQGVEVCIRPWEFKATTNAEFKNALGNAYAVGAVICVTKICGLISQNPEARVAIVLEGGQPNVEWVQKFLISLMMTHPIASVTIAAKQDFTQLHAADFLSHSRSVTDTKWMDRLFAKKRVWEQPIDGEIFNAVSAESVRILKEYRKRKDVEKRERRRARKTAQSSPEFQKFDNAMEQLLSVPHSEIKEKLDAEKEEKRKRKAAKAKKPTGRGASRDSGGGT